MVGFSLESILLLRGFLRILGQHVADQTMQEIAREMRKISPAIDLAAQYIDIPERPGMQVVAIMFPAPSTKELPKAEFQRKLIEHKGSNKKGGYYVK